MRSGEISGAERLIGIDAARFYLVLQRFRKCRAGNQRAPNRRDIAPALSAASNRILRKSGVPL